MSAGTVVVVLFAIACVTWLKSQRYKALGSKREGRLLDQPDHTAREHELEREVEAMRQRIIVLERIATDEKRGNDLSREIESLRD
jgi:cytochrome c-type biogenesis protein CcmH/NrfG